MLVISRLPPYDFGNFFAEDTKWKFILKDIQLSVSFGRNPQFGRGKETSLLYFDGD